MPRYSTRALCVFAIGIAIFVTPQTPVQAQSREDLERIERQIEAGRKQRQSLDQQGREIDRGVSKLRRNLIRTARTAQEQESVLNRLEAKLPELESDASARIKALRDRRRQMTGTLAALERLSRNPPQALLLSDAEPLNIVRNALLLRAALPRLRERATALREDLAGIESVRRELQSRREKIQTASKSLELERNRLNALMVHKAAQRRRMIEEKRLVDSQLANLNQRARSLRELFNNLQRKSLRPQPRPAEKSEAPTDQKIAVSRPGISGINPDQGTMTQPARGRLVERFGQDTGTGTSAKGATFRTRPRAQVVAPFDGHVVFAGPFKGYGQILIIQHGDAYHTLLAGMRRVDATSGQQLLAGEPVGVMGLQEAGTRLYVEVRRKGEPVNPLPWFTAAKDKVRG